MILAVAPAATHAVLDALNRRVDAIPSTILLSRSVASLVDAQRQAAGARLVSLDLPGWFAAVLLQVIALIYFWRSGGAARTRDALRAHLGSEFAVRFTFGAILALIARAASLVPSFYLWRVDRMMGLSTALTRVWAYEYVLGTILGMIAGGLIASITLWLVDRTHQWYLYAIGGIIAISLLGTLTVPYVFAPLFEHYTPLEGIAGTQARAFARRLGYARAPIVVEHRIDRIPAQPADTQGMGTTQRIVLADSTIRVSTPAEIEYYIAAEVAVLNDREPLRLALIDAAIVIFGAAVAVVLADRIPFRRDDDPVSRLAIVGSLLALLYIGAVPIDHAVVYTMQLRADRQAVGMTNDPAAALRAFVRAGDERIEQVCPSAMGRIFLYRTPALGARAHAIDPAANACV
jgi:hypothetical protein